MGEQRNLGQLVFFFQAEDGIRDGRVTGVQTCALPISVPGGTHGKNEEVPPGIASRENAAAGIWSVCDQQPATAWRREARDIQLSRLHAYLREKEEQRNVHGAAANDPQKVADEVERGESRASTTDARTHSQTRQMAASGGAWTPPVLRSAHEQPGAGSLSIPSGTALASLAVAA